MRACALAVTPLACAAAFAPGAHAATVSLVDAGEGAPGRFALSYGAAAGEANRLIVRETDPGRAWSFRDEGAPVVAGPNCVAGADGVVTCTAPAPKPANGPPPVNTVAIALGDGDDVLRISASRFGGTEVDAGPGDDDLVVTAGWVQARWVPETTARAARATISWAEDCAAAGWPSPAAREPTRSRPAGAPTSARCTSTPRRASG